MDKCLKISLFSIFFSVIGLLVPAPDVHAQQSSRIFEGVWKAKVLETSNQTKAQVPGTNKVMTLQSLKAELLSGPQKGKEVFIEGDYLKLKPGDVFLVNYYINNGVEVFTVNEPERRPYILGLILLFIITIVWFGKKQGVRSLLSLVGAFLVIFYVLIPGLLKGWSPVFLSTSIAAFILFFAIFFTHGFNKGSAIAYTGTMLAVAVTAILAGLSVFLMKFTGFAAEGSVTLNFRIAPQLDFVGLLLGGIIIGVLGVLDDIAVTQVAVVRELITDKTLQAVDVYKKAIRVGRDHVGALVNTLALAYTGAALPMLILLSVSAYDASVILNQEVFASELVRIIVGSIGLVLTVPITTGLAVLYYKKNVSGALNSTLDKKEKESSGCFHGHNHH